MTNYTNANGLYQATNQFLNELLVNGYNVQEAQEKAFSWIKELKQEGLLVNCTDVLAINQVGKIKRLMNQKIYVETMYRNNWDMWASNENTEEFTSLKEAVKRFESLDLLDNEKVVISVYDEEWDEWYTLYTRTNEEA